MRSLSHNLAAIENKEIMMYLKKNKNYYILSIYDLETFVFHAVHQRRR
jgi:hypothetical protein